MLQCCEFRELSLGPVKLCIFLPVGGCPAPEEEDESKCLMLSGLVENTTSTQFGAVVGIYCGPEKAESCTACVWEMGLRKFLGFCRRFM